jgi:pimeloyl-ACP methyl ester carboxylesterase
MRLRLSSLARQALKALIYGTFGASLMLIIGFVWYLNSRADLSVWHRVELDEEFTTHSAVNTLGDYLALEERLFRQLDEKVYARIPSAQRSSINRYHRGSLSDPQNWSPNWNRSFELPAPSARAGVLLLHGMSDSPYSLRHLGQSLNTAGAHVLGLRLPGHGTAPSGLVELSWQDMAAAVRLAMRYLAQQLGERPLYIVGYSNGAALAVHYALAALEDAGLPRAERLALLSPAIGVSPVAALAVWQARLGHLLGLDKLAWNSILPEYDPFKYNSFAVNAGDVVYRLTQEIQRRIDTLQQRRGLEEFPLVLAFSSVVDATVSIPALVRGLFSRLPADAGHELVLFDINHRTDIEPLMQWDPDATVRALQEDPDRTFVLNLIGNATDQSAEVALRRFGPGDRISTESGLGFEWPDGVYSLSHVAIPFPAEDSLYGGRPPPKAQGLHLGNVALRGERGVLNVSASEMLRLRWNPFYPYLRQRVLNFLGLSKPQTGGEGE